MNLRRTPIVALLALLGAQLVCAPAFAWEIETHVGLTQRAAAASHLDAWLRAHGLGAGSHEALGFEMRTEDARRLARPVRDQDRDLLDDLAMLDGALGVAPDNARQPALSWLLAGAALEGARVDRLRNHFIDPRRGFGPVHSTGLAEGSAAARVAGLGSARNVLTGAGFDGTGERADRWMAAPVSQNPLSRVCVIEELYLAAASPTPGARASALAHALVCAGAVVHVLEAVGDPAHARGDFAVNLGVARAPFARWALERYGLSVPSPREGGLARTTLASFVTTSDGLGLADEVGRNFVSPGTLPGSERALPSPSIIAGREPRGGVAGALVQHLAAYERTGTGVQWTFPPKAIAETVDALLPRIASEASLLLDFLFRGSLSLEVVAATATSPLKVSVRDGALALGVGQIELFLENKSGARRRVQGGPTQGTRAGSPIADFELGNAVMHTGDDHAVVAVFRGVDEHGEPLVLSSHASF